MFQNLYPSEDYDSAYQIDYEGFYDKGYRGILFDVDNTLVEHDQPVTLPAIELFENLKEMGFKTCIISNNKDYRVKPLALSMYIKPESHQKQAMKRVWRLWEQTVKILFL